MSFNVTVGPKPDNHPFYEKGSKLCFYIDGIPGRELELMPGKEYIFNINARGHPFYFTTSQYGGSDDNDILPDYPPTDQGTVRFIMPESYPDTFYYQCKIHSYMGSHGKKIHNTFYIQSVVSGLVAPTSLTAPEGDDNNIYVADQIGIVYKCNLYTKDVSIFLDVRQYIPTLNPDYDERGLLGLCFDPDFLDNGKVFIYYSSISGRNGYNEAGYYNCLSEFTYNNGVILYESEKVILRMNRKLSFHNGGKIGFGPDGYLYITVGDGGDQKDPDGNGQNLRTWFGKILRIDVNNNDRYPYYKIPQDNPFVNVNGALPEIWAYGFRNPWGLEFLPNTDNNPILVITDSGYESGSGQEEVNVVIKGGNYGWNIKEGQKIASWAPKNTDTSDMIDPIFSYTTSDPNYSDSSTSTIIGGYFINDSDYICADYSGRLIRLRINHEGVQVIETGTLGKWILSFGKTNTNGKTILYILTSDMTGPRENTGEIFLVTVI